MKEDNKVDGKDVKTFSLYDIESESYITHDVKCKELTAGLIKSEADMSNITKWMEWVRIKYDEKKMKLGQVQKNMINYLYSFYVKKQGDQIVKVPRNLGISYACCVFLVTAALSCKCSTTIYSMSRDGCGNVANLQIILDTLGLENSYKDHVFTLKNGSQIKSRFIKWSSGDYILKFPKIEISEMLTKTKCIDVLEINI
jgi:hypothetical protein